MRGIGNNGAKYKIEKGEVVGTLQQDGAIPILSVDTGDVLSVCVNSPQLFCPSVLKSSGFYYATLRHYSTNELLVNEPVNLIIYYIKK